MKLTENIKSSVKPIEVEKSEDKVYVRKNIKFSAEIDPVFQKSYGIYTYDEEVYNRIEYLEKRVDELEKLILE